MKNIRTDIVNDEDGEVLFSFYFDPMVSGNDVLKLEPLEMFPAETKDFKHMVRQHDETTMRVKGKQARVNRVEKTLNISFDKEATYLQIDVYVDLEITTDD